MNRKFFRNCMVIGIIGLLIIGAAGALWYFFIGASTVEAKPTLTLIQPGEDVDLVSGQGLVFVVEGKSTLGLDRIEFYVDGQLQNSNSVYGGTQVRGVFTWFGGSLGEHQLSAVGYDRGGRASQPVSVMVTVNAADVPALVRGAESLDVRQAPEDFVPGGAGAGQGDAAPAGGDPAAQDPAAPQGDQVPDPAQEDQPEPVLGDPLQADDEPPTAMLTLNAHRAGNGVAVSINAQAHDNVGLELMQLIVQPPGLPPREYVADCDGAMDCIEEGAIPALAAGPWAFILRAFDLAGQASLPEFALVQVICLGGVDENNQPILNCAVAEEVDPAPGGPIPGADAGGQGFLDPDADPVFEPIDAAEELLCRGLEAPQETFLAGGNCRVILPVSIPGGPFTDCPGGNFSLLDADLRGVDLRNANFYQGDLRRTNLTCGADLRGADLRLALFQGTKVTASTQLDAKWRLVWELVNQGGYLRDLNGVDLQEAGLAGVDLFGAGLNGALLSGADLRHTNLFAADLTGANLGGVTWGDTTCPDGSNSDNNGGTCEGILAAPLARNESFMIGNCEIVLPVNLPDGPFTDCEHEDLHGADLRHVDLRNANLFDVDFTDADLRGADLTGADLRGTRFSGAIIDETTLMEGKWKLVWRIATRGAWRQDLSGVDLSWGMLEFSDLSEAILDGADLSHTDFRGGSLEGARFNGTIWFDTWCPDGANSDDVGGTCEGH